MPLNFDQQIQTIASKLRGAYLNMSCDLEYMLVDMTCSCLIKNQIEKENVRNILLEGATMSKKIMAAQRALNKYDINLYNKYTPNFEKFKELGGWRNKFAHSIIKGDTQENDAIFVIFTYIHKGEMITQTENVNDLYLKLLGFAPYIYTMMNEIFPILYKESNEGSQPH